VNTTLSVLCTMGPRDEGGIVNEFLRVHGTVNPRVWNASVFPALLRGAFGASSFRGRGEGGGF